MYGIRLRELRIERGLSQIDLAKQFNISQRAISHYENEIHDLSTDLIIAICKFFDVSADYLLGLKDY